MTKSLENPFKQSSDAPADLFALAEQGFLSPDDIAKLRELEDRRTSNVERQMSVEGLSLDEGLSAGERKRLVENKEAVRNELIKWAESYELGDESWVDGKFEIRPNGSIVCHRTLDLYSFNEIALPKNLKQIIGGLYLNGLKSANGLILPDKVEGDLDFFGLESVVGLKLPRGIGGYLNLSSVPTAKGLELTDVDGDVFLSSVPEEERQELRKKYPHLKIK